MSRGELVFRVIGVVLSPILALSFCALFLTAFFLVLPIMLVIDLGTLRGLGASILSIAPFLLWNWVGAHYFDRRDGRSWWIDWPLRWTIVWAAVAFLIYNF